MSKTISSSISNSNFLPNGAFIYGTLTSVEALFAFGVGGIASLVSWEGGKTVKIGRMLINIPETITQNFVSDIFGNPSGWLLDLIMEYFDE